MGKLGRAALFAVALLALASQRAFAAEPREIGPPPPEPEWARGIRRKLEARKVSFEFKDTPLTEAVAFIQTLTKVTTIIDPDAAEAKGVTPITLKVTNERIDVALRRILAVAGLDYAVTGHAVYVSTPEGIAAAMREEAWVRVAEERALRDGGDPALRRKLARKVVMEFVDTPFSEAVIFLQTLTETTITIDAAVPEAKREVPITLKVTSQQLAVVLRRICDAAGLQYTAVGRAVVISMPRPEWPREFRAQLERKISLQFVDTPLLECLAFMRTLMGVSMIVEPEAAEVRGRTPVTLKVAAMPIDEALGWTCRFAGLDWTFTDQALVISTPERIAELRRRHALGHHDAARLPDGVWEVDLRRKLACDISFEFVDTPLSETLEFLQTIAEATIIADPNAFEGKRKAPVTLKVTNMKLAHALRWVLRMVDLEYGLVDGAIFVSTPERIAATRRAIRVKRFAEALRPPAEWRRAIRDKLERTTSLTFVGTRSSEALQFVRMLTGLNIILDPVAGGAGLPIMFRAKSIRLDHALGWITRLAGCDWTLVDGAVFVSTPEHATAELLRSAERRAARETDWRGEMAPGLARKETLSFAGTPALEAFETVRALADVDLVVDSPAHDLGGKKVWLEVADMPLATAFAWVAQRCGLRRALIDEAVFVSTPERIAEIARLEAARLEREAAREGVLEWWEPDIKRTLSGSVKLDLRDKPFGEALGVLSKTSGLAIAIDAEAEEDLAARPVSLKVAHGMRAGAALRWLCRLAGADCRMSEKGALVSTPEALRGREIDAALARRIALKLPGVPFADAVERIGTEAGVPVGLDPGLQDTTNAAILTRDDMTVRQALDRLAGLENLEWAVRDGAVLVSTPAVISGRPEPEPALLRPEDPPARPNAPLTDEDDVF